MKKSISKICFISINSFYEMFINTFFQLLFTFLPVIISIIALMCLGDSWVKVINKSDILGGLIISSVCLILQAVQTKLKNRSILSCFSCIYILVGGIFYVILVIKDKLNDISSIHYDWIQWASLTGVVLSVFLIFFSNYDKNKNSVQKKADESRDIESGQVGGIKLKVGEK